ncbi:MAG: hypothetical protein ACYCT1_08495 [Steroidobacteraceae bacterium]
MPLPEYQLTLRDALPSYTAKAGTEVAKAAADFLAWGGEATPASLGRYLRSLQEADMADGTVDKRYRYIRAFVRHAKTHCGVDVEVPRVANWNYDPDEAESEVLLPDTVAELIRVAKHGLIAPQVAAWLALATTYGLRAGELLLMKGQIDVAGERIRIRSEKGSRHRWCWLPPEVVPWLQGYASRGNVYAGFASLWAAATDNPKPEGVAWHSVRYAVVDGLTNAGVGDADLERFMRWAPSRRMLAHYRKAKVAVGLAGSTRIPEEDDGLRAADRVAWDAHPFIGLWR